MKKLLVLLLLLCGPPAYAFTIGFQSVRPSVTSKFSTISLEGNSEFGFSADFIFSIPIDGTFSFQPGLAIAQKNFSLRALGSGALAGLDVTGRWEITSAEIPLLVRAQLVEMLSLFAGTRISVAISDNCTLQSELLAASVTSDACGGLQSLTTPLIMGIGINFFPGVGTEVYYQLALQNIVENTSYDLKINSFGLNLIFDF